MLHRCTHSKTLAESIGHVANVALMHTFKDLDRDYKSFCKCYIDAHSARPLQRLQVVLVLHRCT